MPLNTAIKNLASEIALMNKPGEVNKVRKASKLRGSIIEN